MNEIPTITEEIDRKALEQIERLLRHYNQFKISEAQLATGIEVIYGCISGIASPDITEALSKHTPRSLKHQNIEEVCLVNDKGFIVKVSRTDYGERIDVTTDTNSEKITRSYCLNNSIEAHGRLVQIQKALIDRGYRRI